MLGAPAVHGCWVINTARGPLSRYLACGVVRIERLSASARCVMRTMNSLAGIGCALLFGCQSGLDAPAEKPGAAAGFVLIRVDAATGIEARQVGAGRRLAMSARFSGSDVLSTISDDGNVLTALTGPAATTALDPRSIAAQAAAGQGADGLSVADLESLASLYDSALGRLFGAVPPATRSSPLVTHLSGHRMLVRALLAKRQRGLLQEWGTEATRALQLGDDERGQLATILHRYSEALAGSGSADALSAAQREIEELLGPARHGLYQRHRGSWLMSRGVGVQGVVP
jgi:hypothetical protein